MEIYIEMSLGRELKKRSGNKCELCSNEESLIVFTLEGAREQNLKTQIYACKTCVSQIEDKELAEENHWRCLNDSMWNENEAVQVQAWRMLSRLREKGWTQDLLDMMYFEEDVLDWAKSTGEGEEEEGKLIHRDVNGVQLNAGDSVVLIKDLKVKGSSMVAKQGTAVRRISLDHINDKYIEGKVGAQQIVIITDYVKKL